MVFVTVKFVSGRVTVLENKSLFGFVHSWASVFLLDAGGWGNDRSFWREAMPWMRCSISWCAVARSCLVQLFVLSEQAKKPGD